jgi:hypothetical protein
MQVKMKNGGLMFIPVIVDNVHQKLICSVLHLLIFLAQNSFFMAEIKGRSIQINCELICLTSIESPKVLYNNIGHLDHFSIMYPEILRRVGIIIRCEVEKYFFEQKIYLQKIVMENFVDKNCNSDQKAQIDNSNINFFFYRFNKCLKNFLKY